MEKSEQIRNYRNVRPGQGKPGTVSLSLPLEIGKGHGVSAFCSVGTKDAPQRSFETETHKVFLKCFNRSQQVSMAVEEAEQEHVLGALVICISHSFCPKPSDPPLNSQIEISAASLRDLGQK